MLGLRMSPWVSLTMALILCLTLTFNYVTKAQEAILIGSVYCDTCFHQYFSPSSHFISGASVAVECGGDEIEASIGKPRFREEVKTDLKGKFKVKLPFSATKHVNEIKRCSVKLISSSESDCAVPAISTATSSSIRLKVKTAKNHVFTTGFFTFQPLEQPKRCQWESHANANDEIIASPPSPSPVVDGMLAPTPLAHRDRFGRKLRGLKNENNLRSSHPVNQILPSFPSQQPPRSFFIPEVPPPPNTMLNTGFQAPPDSMFNTNFQPPPDSMFNIGFPPPDSMFNTAFQPPPASMPNTGFQPPPDSMFNAGFQPPPDFVLNPSFQPPPDSVINIGFHPPPDSMLNTDFQPPPDSMFNTGFQPPADSMTNAGFQPPPPDTMFNPNPLPPPSDSTVDQSQPSPPSLTPHLPTPTPPASLSPSLPSPPVDPQPDLVQATPPPPADPTFPAFPFQPSAGLP